jgi:hypothetical protein
MTTPNCEDSACKFRVSFIVKNRLSSEGRGSGFWLSD